MAQDLKTSVAVAVLAVGVAAGVGVLQQGSDARFVGRVDVTEAPVPVAVDLTPAKGEVVTRDSAIFKVPKDVSKACACSSGADCVQWAPSGPTSATLEPREAPLGVALWPGTWRGSGCVLLPCTQLSGEPSAWPKGCPGGAP